jgi:hypothetical protein
MNRLACPTDLLLLIPSLAPVQAHSVETYLWPLSSYGLPGLSRPDVTLVASVRMYTKLAFSVKWIRRKAGVMTGQLAGC